MGLQTLNEFEMKYYPDAVRPNLFYVKINFPSDVITAADLSEKSRWLVQSASLPGRTAGVIEVPFRGAKLKYSGNTVYGDWVATFLQDPSFQLGNAIDLWMEYIESFPVGIRAVDVSYKTTVEICQQDGRQNIIKKYILIGAFPSDKSEVPVGHEENDMVETFDVTWSFDYFLTSLNI